MTTTPDEFDAVRTITKTLEGFSPENQKLILRWAAEKLGITVPLSDAGGGGKGTDTGQGSGGGKSGDSTTTDIKSFTTSKTPKNDLQFATVVAYFYRFEAKEEERKISIKAQDLIDASRKVNWPRPKRPTQTLLNTVNAGLLDKLGGGNFEINSVGENLVAVTLPGGGSEATMTKKNKKPAKNKQPAKKKK